MTQPLISVVIPTHNSAHYLGEAIESVMAQTYPLLEIIVVDDGSTDDTRDVVAQFSVVNYLHQSNAGAGAARNRGVAAAQGELIAFLDADDLWLQDKLSRQLFAMTGQPDVAMVFSHAEEFCSAEIQAPPITRLRTYAPGYVPGTMLVKSDVLRQVGPFSTSYQLGEFIDWYIRSRELGYKSLMLKEVLLRRRLHLSNLGVRKRRHQTDYAAVIKAALNRRRELHFQ